MTEADLVAAILRSGVFSHTLMHNVANKNDIDLMQAGTIRRNMLYAGLLAHETYRPTDELVRWATEHASETVPLSSRSFRPAETKKTGWVRKEKEAVMADRGRPVKTPVERDDKQRHMDICAEVHETWVSKNHDYGDSFAISCQEFGLVAGIVRMSDKWNRIKTLMKNEAKVADESMRDSLLDLAGYALMMVMLIDKKEA